MQRLLANVVPAAAVYRGRALQGTELLTWNRDQACWGVAREYGNIICRDYVGIILPSSLPRTCENEHL